MLELLLIFFLFVYLFIFLVYCRSFEAVCSKLEFTLESLRELVNENNVPTKDALIQLAFSAIQSVHSVRHQNLKAILWRNGFKLLIHLQYCLFVCRYSAP